MSRSTIAYQPALDGVRALAVSAVLLFHAGLSWMGGGYLGVSVFFTLSGFLITSLLLREHQQSGSIDAAAFYTRRARRLLPASLVCVAAVCLLAAAGAFDGLANLRRDVLGALLQVFNWVKLASGESYADLTAAQAGLRRPLDHYWSLAIEEQFYWCWPLAFLGILWWARRRGTSPMTIVAVLTALFTVAAPAIAGIWGPDAAYWATPARVAEILFGALVACVVAVRPPVSGRAAWWAPAALTALAVACVLFPDGSGPAYEGALPIVGAVSALLIYGLQAPGMMRRVLSVRPLVALGKVSYGVYLYHWPVYVLVDRQAWDLPVVVDLAVKWTITLALTIVSYLAIERPVRSSTWLVPRRTLVGALAGTAVVAALVVVVPAPSKFYAVDNAAAEAVAIDTGSVAPLVPIASSSTVPESTALTSSTIEATSSTLAPSTTTTAVVPPRPVRIVVVGDSVAEATGAGVVAWAAANPQLAQVELVVFEGCGMVLPGYQDLYFGFRDVTATCGGFVNDYIPERIDALHPDLVAIVTSVWDAMDRSLVEGGPVLSPTDPELETVMATSLATLTDVLLARGVPRVAWVNGPVPSPTPEAADNSLSDPARYAVVHRIIDDIATDRPANVRVVDLDGWFQGTPLADDASARPDHVHFTPDAATTVANEFLGQALLRAALT